MVAFLIQYWPLLALGSVLAIALGSYWRFERRIAEPLATLLKAVERLSSGDWQTRVEVPPGGVGKTLGSALERLRINLSDHAATGRALDIMLDSMNDAVFVTSPDGLIKRVNLAATQMLGWSQMELLGREIAFLIADQDRPAFSIEQATN
jgi:PAS domain-containing protein